MKKKHHSFAISAFLALSVWTPAHAAPSGTTEKMDVSYMADTETDPYASERCRLDLYLPEKRGKHFPILVWFHGGALEAGARNEEKHKAFARRFAEKGIGVAMAGYRLSPKVKYPVYIEDAARAVSWVVKHAASLGSDPSMVFVGGHSAGGYLSAMLVMDEHYLRDTGVDVQKIAGFIPMSGQMMTHFTVRKERGVADSSTLAAADEAAPIFYSHKDTPPILLVLGDNDWPARIEENQYFAAMLRKVSKNEKISLVVVPDRDHASIIAKCNEPGDPAGEAMLKFMEKER